MQYIGRIGLFITMAAFAAAVLGSAASEALESDEYVPHSLHLTASAPEVPAHAYVIFDAVTGDVLYNQRGDEVRSIASITKLFTAAAVYDHFDLEETTTLQWADVSAHGTAGNLSPSEIYTYRDLLFPLLLSSSNDAALTYSLRAAASGGHLAEAAEELARSYGPSTIRLADTSGLSANNVASARDIAQSTYALYQSHPYIFNISRVPSYIGPYHGWHNNSPFMSESTYLGGKHGFTNAAGRTAVALFTETIDGVEHTFGYVVLGSDDLVHDVGALRTHVQNSVTWR